MVVFAKDHQLSYAEIGSRLLPPVTRAGVSAWARRVAVPGERYRRQLDEMTCGFVPEAGWAPSLNEVTAARRLLVTAARIQVTDDAAAAIVTVERADRVRGEVKHIPKAIRQRWTRWRQQRLPL